ncbi:MAG TPA: porin family protein [Saprospiraceae bacterium]|nr:porin family protein [Saprospiraceae bacterium]
MKTNTVIRTMSLLAFLTLAINANPLQAQNKVGVVVEAGSSNIDVNGLGILELIKPDIKSIPQYSAGLIYERQLNSQWSIVTGARYATRGFEMREDVNINLMGLDIPVGAKINTRLHYLEVPVAVQFNFTKRGISPYLKAGIAAGYAVEGKIQPYVDAIINWKLPAIPINLENDLYNRFDISAMGSAGISIPTNDIGSIQLEVNYRHSLNDMFQDNITDIRIKSNGIGGGISYTMRF